MFDLTLAIAEMQDDTTAAYRSKYPALVKVWDELDDLRDQVNSADIVDREDYDALEKELDEIEADRDYEIQQRALLLSDCEAIEGKLAAIIDGLADGLLKDQLDELWHMIPQNT